jgi:hypothetical protein
LSEPPPLTRRNFLALTMALPAFAGWASKASGGPRDQGIGGTGVFTLPQSLEGDDRGIGGTGVIGTIRRFGSIVVNGLRIGYPTDVSIRIDDEAATAGALKIGQIVHTVATRNDGQLFTRQINVTSEVIGSVEKARAKKLTVLGQTVSLARVPVAQRRWQVGDRVAVSGLRRPDGTIVASLVERRSGALDQLVGRVGVGADGALMVGRLRLGGVDPAYIGQRAILRGLSAGGVFEVVHSQSESMLLGSGFTRLSMEAYVERRKDGLLVGPGLSVGGVDLSQLPSNHSQLVVLDAVVGGNNEWHFKSLRLESGQTMRIAPGVPGGQQDFLHPGGDRGTLPRNGPMQQRSPSGPSRSAPSNRSPQSGPSGGFPAPRGTMGPGSGSNGFVGPDGSMGHGFPGRGGSGGSGPFGPPGGFGGPPGGGRR